LHSSPNRLYTLNQRVRQDSEDSDDFSPLSHCLDKLLDCVKNAKELKECPGMEQIEYFFREAVRTSNSEYLCKVYTAKTGFYKRLNIQLTKCDEIFGYHQYLDWSNYFAAYLYRLNCISVLWKIDNRNFEIGISAKGLNFKNYLATSPSCLHPHIHPYSDPHTLDKKSLHESFYCRT